MTADQSQKPEMAGQQLVALTFGRSVTVCADQLIELLIIWAVWDLTKSSTVTAVATFAGRAPFWLFAFFGAALVDRFGSMRLLTACNLVAAAVATVASLQLALIGPDVATFVLLAFSLNSARALESAALAAAVPVLVSDPVRHQAANSWFDNAKRIGRLSAPLLSRWMGVISPAAFVALAAVAYGSMAFIAGSIAGFGRERAAGSGGALGFKSALSFALRSRILGPLIGMAAIYAFFHGAAYYVVLPRLSFEIDRGGPALLGLLITLFGVGGIASNLLIARVTITEHMAAVGCGMMAIGLCFVFFAASPPWAAMMVLALLAGASLPFQDIFVTCLIQSHGPPDLVARLHATWRLACEITISLGILVGGLAVDLISAGLTGVFSGLAIILTGGALFIAGRATIPSPDPQAASADQQG